MVYTKEKTIKQSTACRDSLCLRWIIYGGLVLCILIWSGGYSLSLIKAQNRNDIRHHLQEALQAGKETLQLWADARAHDAVLFAGRPEIRRQIQSLLALPGDRASLLDSSALQELRTLMTPWLKGLDDLGFEVIAPDGRILASMEDVHIGKDIGRNGNLARLFQGHDRDAWLAASGSPLIKKGDRKSFHLLVCVPVTGKQQGPTAALCLCPDPEKEFNRLVRMIAGDGVGHSYAVNREGMVLAGFRPGRQLSSFPLVEQIKQGNSGMNLDGYQDNSGLMVIGVWAWLTDHNIGLVKEIPLDAAYRTYYHIRRIVVAGQVCSFLFFLGVLVLLVLRQREKERLQEKHLTEMRGRLESKQRFKRLVENLPNNYFFFSCNAEGKINYLSPSANEILGYPAEKPAEDVPPCLFLDPAKKGEPYRVEVTREDGSIRTLEILQQGIFGDNGQLLAIEGLARDFTKDLQLQDTLRKDRDRLAVAQRVAHVGSWEWLLAPDTLHWSDEVFHIFGRSRKEGIADYPTFLSLVHPEDRDKVDSTVQKALADKTEYSIRHRIIRADGTERVVHERADVVVDEQGRVTTMLGTVQDITEQELVEAELAAYRHHLEELVKKQTAELHQEIRERKELEDRLRRKVTELERFTKMAVGRETMMIALKKEVNELCRQLGHEERYTSSLIRNPHAQAGRKKESDDPFTA